MKKTKIIGSIYPIDDLELYKKSLGMTMLDIIKKQSGEKVLEQSIKAIKEQLKA